MCSATLACSQELVTLASDGLLAVYAMAVATIAMLIVVWWRR